MNKTSRGFHVVACMWYNSGHEREVKWQHLQYQMLIVQGFIAAHEAELLANWESINSENGTFFKINV